MSLEEVKRCYALHDKLAEIPDFQKILPISSLLVLKSNFFEDVVANVSGKFQMFFLLFSKTIKCLKSRMSMFGKCWRQARTGMLFRGGFYGIDSLKR